ncbi:MAG TPA: hypothetical protein VF944_05660 [Candidatus Bathyarchaeia archaeon]
MASAQIVYEAVVIGHKLTGHLFGAKKFWFSARVPQKARFKQQVEVGPVASYRVSR